MKYDITQEALDAFASTHSNRPHCVEVVDLFRRLASRDPSAPFTLEERKAAKVLLNLSREEWQDIVGDTESSPAQEFLVEGFGFLKQLRVNGTPLFAGG